jgi:hypothetical protein
MGNGDLVSWRGALSLFDSILAFASASNRPLHGVNRGIHLGTSVQKPRFSEPKLALSVGSS